MKQLILVSFLLLIGLGGLKAQNISINEDGTAPDGSAMLDVADTAKGVLVPRLTLVQRNNIVNPATGLLIFQTNNDSGFYFNQGVPATPNWLRIKTEEDTNYWNKTNNDLYYNGDNVGIGTNTPLQKIDVRGKAMIGDGFAPNSNNASNQLNLLIGLNGNPASKE